MTKITNCEQTSDESISSVPSTKTYVDETGSTIEISIYSDVKTIVTTRITDAWISANRPYKKNVLSAQIFSEHILSMK